MMLKNKNVKDCIVKIVQKYPFVKDIFHDIDKSGGEILLVGGAVRDHFLGIEAKDLDFEVYHLSIDQLQKILEKHGAVSFIGKSFGVLRLFFFDADFSLPRKDSDGRKPEVFIDQNMPYQESFRRRDLTVNAMGIDVNSGELIDPFGGLIDLEAKILRAPDITLFSEDPLRLFRVMQFVGRLGFSVDEKLSELCRSMDISTISRERVEDEFKKLWLRSRQPSPGLRWLEKVGRTISLFPEIDWSEKIYDLVDSAATKEFDSEKFKLSFMWSAFFFYLNPVQKLKINIHEPVDRAVQKKVEKIIGRYVLSIEQKRMVLPLIFYVSHIPVLVEQQDARWYKWLAWWVRRSSSLGSLFLFGQCLYDKKVVQIFYEVSKSYGILNGPEEPLLTGRDLLDHAPEGPELGKLVDQAYQLQINESIHDKEILLQELLKGSK
jgi:tRNA nucleotidyltransferase (CCA-adding enzyme)